MFKVKFTCFNHFVGRQECSPNVLRRSGLELGFKVKLEYFQPFLSKLGHGIIYQQHISHIIENPCASRAVKAAVLMGMDPWRVVGLELPALMNRSRPSHPEGAANHWPDMRSSSS